MVLMSVFSAVDDTKLVSKAIIGEMADNMAEIASTQYGRKVSLVRVPINVSYFDTKFKRKYSDYVED